MDGLEKRYGQETDLRGDLPLPPLSFLAIETRTINIYKETEDRDWNSEVHI